MLLLGLIDHLGGGAHTLAELLTRRRGFVHICLIQRSLLLEDENSNGRRNGEVENAHPIVVPTAVVQAALNEVISNPSVCYVVTGITQVEHIKILRKRPCAIMIKVESSPSEDYKLIKEDEKRGSAFCSCLDALLPSRSICFASFLLARLSMDLGDKESDSCQRLFTDENSLLLESSQTPMRVEGKVIECFQYYDVTVRRFDQNTSDEMLTDWFDRIKGIPRPSWDVYFMRLAILASSRSNCIKRRVGAVVVSDAHRVIATGYNGTAFSLANCLEGSCHRCWNPSVRQGQKLDECICIHAEMNALQEAGNGRCKGSTLFVTTKPCLTCAKMILQAGIGRVVYCLEYDQHGAPELLKMGGVELNQYTGPTPLEAIHLFMP